MDKTAALKLLYLFHISMFRLTG